MADYIATTVWRTKPVVLRWSRSLYHEFVDAADRDYFVGVTVCTIMCIVAAAAVVGIGIHLDRRAERKVDEQLADLIDDLKL